MLTGDDVTAGDEPESRRVFDIDSTQAINIARIITTGKYLSGRKIDPAPDFYISAVENPAAPPFDYRIELQLVKRNNTDSIVRVRSERNPTSRHRLHG